MILGDNFKQQEQDRAKLVQSQVVEQNGPKVHSLSKSLAKQINNNPMRKGIKMTRIADKSARKLRCFVDTIFKE